MTYGCILRLSIDLFNVDRLQLNYFVNKFQLSIHLGVKELSPYSNVPNKSAKIKHAAQPFSEFKQECRPKLACRPKIQKKH